MENSHRILSTPPTQPNSFAFPCLRVTAVVTGILAIIAAYVLAGHYYPAITIPTISNIPVAYSAVTLSLSLVTFAVSVALLLCKKATLPQSSAIPATAAKPPKLSTPPATAETIPNEIWIEIFSMLKDDATLANIPCVCKRFRILSQSPLLATSLNLALSYRIIKAKVPDHHPLSYEVYAAGLKVGWHFIVDDKLREDEKLCVQMQDHLMRSHLPYPDFREKVIGICDLEALNLQAHAEYRFSSPNFKSLMQVLLHYHQIDDAAFLWEKIVTIASTEQLPYPTLFALHASHDLEACKALFERTKDHLSPSEKSELRYSIAEKLAEEGKFDAAIEYALKADTKKAFSAISFHALKRGKLELAFTFSKKHHPSLAVCRLVYQALMNAGRKTDAQTITAIITEGKTLQDCLLTPLLHIPLLFPAHCEAVATMYELGMNKEAKEQVLAAEQILDEAFQEYDKRMIYKKYAKLAQVTKEPEVARRLLGKARQFPDLRVPSRNMEILVAIIETELAWGWVDEAIKDASFLYEHEETIASLIDFQLKKGDAAGAINTYQTLGRSKPELYKSCISIARHIQKSDPIQARMTIQTLPSGSHRIEGYLALAEISFPRKKD